MSTPSGDESPEDPNPSDPRVLAERVRMLYARATIAQATVVANAVVVAWVFRELVPPPRSLAWLATVCALAASRLALARAFARREIGPLDAARWARRFAVGAALTGACWGAAVLVFYAPASTVHQFFLAFVLGGMTAGAASSNASYMPAFAAFSAPALLPMVVRLAAARDPVHAAMAFMLVLFGVAVAAISVSGNRTVDEALRLRFRNEALVGDLVASQRRLETVNAELERRVRARTGDLERALALHIAAETRLAVTLRSIGDAVIATERDGRVTLFNPVAEALTGWSAPDAIGRPLDEVFRLLGPTTRARAEDPLAAMEERRVVGPRSRTLVARGGREVPIASTAAPIRDASGDVLGAVVAFRDRTNDLQAEEALRASDRRKDEFIALLSHELRNPLAAIRNSLYLLERAPRDAGGFALPREVIDRQVTHLARLVDDLLDTTRISRGKIELRRARVDLSDIVRRTCADHGAAFRERRVALCVEAKGEAWIDADETRIAQVVGNLLHNAAKFSRPDGTVIVRVGAAAGRAEVRVRDDGVGISPELLPHVFEPFVQAAPGRARVSGGLGLGLALVKELVELHGGHVQARSEGADRGAELTVSMPLSEAPERRALERPPAEAAAPNVAPANVLVIEDNADSANTVAEALGLEGHRVRVARDARSGMAMARELRPDVVLCDIGLPDMDGYEVARELRADERFRTTRFIALSGYAQSDDRRRAAEAGFDRHISKPAAIETVLAEVAGARGHG